MAQWDDAANNPCLEAAKASYKCLNDNGYDRVKCADFFEAYKRCKKDWNKARAYNRTKGLPPLKPSEFRQMTDPNSYSVEGEGE